MLSSSITHSLSLDLIHPLAIGPRDAITTVSAIMQYCAQFSFVGAGNRTQFPELDSKCFYQLSHLSSSTFLLKVANLNIGYFYYSNQYVSEWW